MTLDIRGGLKNTKINKNYYAVIDELLSNAIDSYLIRKNSDQIVAGLNVVFQIELFSIEMDQTKLNLKITCTDNGMGFGDDQTKAFVTKDTSYKDDLPIAGIGKCKGSGRIQFLHYFYKLKIDSTYKDGEDFKNRTLIVDEEVKEIDEKSFKIADCNHSKLKTSVTLDTIKSDVHENLFSDKNLKDKFSTESLKQYVMVAFLQRFVGLKEKLGDFCIEFITVHGDERDSQKLIPSELPDIFETKNVNIFYQDDKGVFSSDSVGCTISHYKLDRSAFKLKRNTVALCAKSSIAKLITNKYLKTKTLENNPVKGFYHIILIESDFLDTYVNEQRDDFNLPKLPQGSDNLFKRLISFQEIFDGLEGYILKMLEPPDWDKQKIITKVENKYGISANMVAEVNVRVHYGDTEETITKRVLGKYQEKIIKDTSEIFNLKEEISKSDPNSDDFREKINEISWKYTSSLKSIDMANLSQVVVRRAAILEILHLAINGDLNIQNTDDIKRKENEKIIHNIFFPMRKDSEEIKDHDIWILNEEYHYYDYIVSDQPLSKIKWNERQPLFDSDIDEELSKILKKTYGDNSEKRPDIAIFNSEGSAIIIEFKAPGVSMDNHTGDLMEYAQLLAAKSNGKLKKFYGYLIGDEVNPNRLNGYTRFPNGHGWFSTVPVTEHSTNQRLGELYSEILFYGDIVDRANKRLDVYKNRLNLALAID